MKLSSSTKQTIDNAANRVRPVAPSKPAIRNIGKGTAAKARVLLIALLHGLWSTQGRLVDMPDYDGLMRIFWPADIARSEFPGVIVGWRNSVLDVTVVAVLDVSDVSFRRGESCFGRARLLTRFST
jgi:hypothetical protein